MAWRSGCQRRFLQGDGVTEAFELCNEPSGLSFGVPSGEVLAAEVVVKLTGAQHVPDRAQDRVLHGAERFLVTAAGLQPGVLGGEVDILGPDRGERGFLERPVQPLRSFRLLPERRLPADWSLPGHCPAHEARCLSVGNTDMSIPISEMITSAARR